jgi:hypothetical protein
VVSAHRKKRRLQELIVFVCLLSIIWYLFSNIFNLKSESGIIPMKELYRIERGAVDVLVLGSSHAYCAINPAIIYRNSGISAYDLCGSVQPMWNTYYYLKEALKTQTPKLVVLDVFGVQFDIEYGEPGNIVINNYGLRPSRNKIDSLRASAPEGEFLDYFIEANQFHSRYASLNEEDFHMGDYYAPSYFLGAFLAPHAVALEEPGEPQEAQPVGLPAKSEEYYRRIIDLCVMENIPLEVVVSPYIVWGEQKGQYRQAEMIAGEYDVPFTDFNRMYADIGLDFSRDFLDNDHLNYRGSEKFTEYVTRTIFSKYKLPDHRGDGRYALWSENAQAVERQLQNLQLMNQDNAETYLNLLADRADKYLVAFAYAQPDAEPQGRIPAILSQFNIDQRKFSRDRVARLDRGEIAYPRSAASKPYLDVGRHVLDYSSPGTILMDRKEISPAPEGLNMLVIDKSDNEVVDCVGFDREGGMIKKE